MGVEGGDKFHELDPLPVAKLVIVLVSPTRFSLYKTYSLVSLVT